MAPESADAIALYVVVERLSGSLCCWLKISKTPAAVKPKAAARSVCRLRTMSVFSLDFIDRSVQ
jgi:hypothetical protein